MRRNWHFKKVIRHEYFRHPSCPRRAQGSICHHLECGHSVWTKYSQGEPERKHCRECAIANGGEWKF